MISRLLFAGTLAAEGLAAQRRFAARAEQYQLAQARALAAGRPLVVVGDPDAGLHTRFARAYGCGDVCIDLLGCPACPNSVTVDLAKGSGLADNSAVVFVSCVLEYVDDFAGVAKELLRVAGGHENLFIVTVQPWTFTAHLYPGAKQTVMWDAASGALSFAPVSGVRKALAAGLFGSLAWSAVKG